MLSNTLKRQAPLSPDAPTYLNPMHLSNKKNWRVDDILHGENYIRRTAVPSTLR